MGVRTRRVHATSSRAALIVIPGIGLALVDRGVVYLSGPSWAAVLEAAAALALPGKAFRYLLQTRRGFLESILSLRRH